MAIPLSTTGSLSPTFVPARPVRLAVKLPSAFTQGTFGRLRCSFGGDRPSQTARLRLSAASLRLSLEFQ